MTDLAARLDSLNESLRDGVSERVARGELGLLKDDELLAVTGALEALGRRIDSLRITAAGEIDHRSRPELGPDRLSAMRGCRTPAELLERVTLVAASTARGRMRAAGPLRPGAAFTGEALPPDLPRVAHAFASGSLGADAAAAVCAALAPLIGRTRIEDLDAAESALVAAALGDARTSPASADEVRIMAQTWALVLDPDGSFPDEAKAMRRRGLTLGREREGITPLTAGLTPEAAAQLQRLLDAYDNPHGAERRGPFFTVDDEETEDSAGDLRTPAQRRHDALAAILGVAARAAETPTTGGSAPTLVVTIGADELESFDGHGFIEGTDAVVPASFARQIACTGALQRVVVGANGRVLQLGSPLRTFTTHQRRAIAQRDGGCIIPGCHVGATWCEVHHVTAHARGGSTHTDNGVLLCWFHHRTIETSGWQVAMIDGMPHVKAPHWIDAHGRWRPTSGSLHRRRDRVARSRAPARDG